MKITKMLKFKISMCVEEIINTYCTACILQATACLLLHQSVGERVVTKYVISCTTRQIAVSLTS